MPVSKYRYDTDARCPSQSITKVQRIPDALRGCDNGQGSGTMSVVSLVSVKKPSWCQMPFLLPSGNIACRATPGVSSEDLTPCYFWALVPLSQKKSF